MLLKCYLIALIWFVNLLFTKSYIVVLHYNISQTLLSSGPLLVEILSNWTSWSFLWIPLSYWDDKKQECNVGRMDCWSEQSCFDSTMKSSLLIQTGEKAVSYSFSDHDIEGCSTSEWCSTVWTFTLSIMPSQHKCSSRLQENIRALWA